MPPPYVAAFLLPVADRQWVFCCTEASMTRFRRAPLAEGRLDANVKVLVTNQMRADLIQEARRKECSLGELIRYKLMTAAVTADTIERHPSPRNAAARRAP